MSDEPATAPTGHVAVGRTAISILLNTIAICDCCATADPLVVYQIDGADGRIWRFCSTDCLARFVAFTGVYDQLPDDWQAEINAWRAERNQ